MEIQTSERLRSLPPYLFLEMDRLKRSANSRGVNLIDFGVGDPDQPTPEFVIKALSKALRDPGTHHYPLDYGNLRFREAVAEWYRRRFKVSLDPSSEVLPLIGSKDGLTHMPLAVVNPGDKVLVPDPAYPAYRSAVIFAGGRPMMLPLYKKNGFLPDWREVEKTELSGVKMVYLNYPNNPTGATADLDFFNRTVEFAKKHRIIVCHDNAYSEIYQGRKRPPSFLEAADAKSVGVEFHSLSKTFNMTGWRIGFVCGNAGLIAALARVKSNMDSGVFSAIQLAGSEALKHAASFAKKMNALYSKRRKLLLAGFKVVGWNVAGGEAAFYIWIEVPARWKDSIEFCKFLLEKTGIVAAPGAGFGECGKGFARFTLTVPETRIREALRRLEVSLK